MESHVKLSASATASHDDDDFHREVLANYGATELIPSIVSLTNYCVHMVSRRAVQRTLAPVAGNPMSRTQLREEVSDRFEIMLSKYGRKVVFGRKLTPVLCGPLLLLLTLGII